jgi:hypothetical protein
VSVLKLHRVFLALLMAFAMSMAFSGCSSSEEESSSSDTGSSDSGSGCYEGENGVCCEFDAMQAGCEDYQPDL